MTQPPVAAESLPENQTPELPAPIGRITIVGVLAIVAGVALVPLIMGGPSKSFPGQLTARIVPVTVDRAGVLTEWLVDEGDPIQIGDSLANVSVSELVEERNRLKEDIARLTTDLERANAQAELDLEWRLKDINAEIFTARIQSAELLEEKYRHEMEQVALSDLLNDNTTALWAPRDSVYDAVSLQKTDSPSSRLNTVLRVEAANNSAVVCQAQVEMCEEQVELLEELKDSLPDRVRRSVGVDVIEGQLADAQARLDELMEDESATTISSEVIGQAGVFLREVGDHVFPGDRIVEIFDDVRRYVTVDVPSSHVDTFTVGKSVGLNFPGNIERKGRIVNVAPQAITPGQGQESLVRVQIEPAGILWPSVPIDSQVMVHRPK
ncbi:MAG: HlyD family efflux transporter periplasmic adaptor subunit [Planctomycetaceae bacterium]|nr:HlyD family efflux transporter periplasmic adaptor subunit [Planctomycetaceae bacterium]